MVHHSQKVRMQNLCLVKKLIAQSMPLGAKTDKLIAVLCTTYGFHRRTVSEYLEDLRASERIVYDVDKKRWRLPSG